MDKKQLLSIKLEYADGSIESLEKGVVMLNKEENKEFIITMYCLNTTGEELHTILQRIKHL